MRKSKLLRNMALVGSLLLMMSACSSWMKPVTFETEVGFCRVAETQLPVRLSRKDTQKTIDDVGGINFVYRCMCDEKWKIRQECKDTVSALKQDLANQ